MFRTHRPLHWVAVAALAVFLIVFVIHLGFMGAMAGSGPSCHVAGGNASCLVSDTLQQSLAGTTLTIAVILFVAIVTARVRDPILAAVTVAIRFVRRRAGAIRSPMARAMAAGILQRREAGSMCSPSVRAHVLT